MSFKFFFDETLRFRLTTLIAVLYYFNTIALWYLDTIALLYFDIVALQLCHYGITVTALQLWHYGITVMALRLRHYGYSITVTALQLKEITENNMAHTVTVLIC